MDNPYEGLNLLPGGFVPFFKVPHKADTYASAVVCGVTCMCARELPLPAFAYLYLAVSGISPVSYDEVVTKAILPPPDLSVEGIKTVCRPLVGCAMVEYYVSPVILVDLGST